ncbi:amidase signature domain-containing protein [Aspergillus crustosus]
MADPYLLSATEVLGLFEKNALTVEHYARSLLGRINERDGIVKAWAYLDPELVLEQARALDQIPYNKRGPLHGLAIGIKEIAHTKDMPTQFGSAIYTGHQSCYDSSAVAILRDAGALIFGKTTTAEMTVANPSPNTTNPHDSTRTPGDSSCGSAAAVADFQVPLSLGAQTGGSVIRPASYTGVFAMKPTYNAISLEGQKPLAPTFDTLGFFARSIDDLQLLADVFAIRDDEAPEDIPIQSVSVALMKTPMWTQAGSGTITAIEKAVTSLQNCGARVDEVPFPPELSDAQALGRIQKVIMSSESQRLFLREYRLDKAHLAPKICAVVENTANYTNKEATEALDTYAGMRVIINELAKNYSVILTPSAGFHMPAINIPAFIGAHGMPIGVSLVAPRFRDQHLLRISKILGEALIAGGGWRILLLSKHVRLLARAIIHEDEGSSSDAELKAC